MPRNLYPSVDAMLAPETLSVITRRSIATVQRQPFNSVDSLSGSRFLQEETNGGAGPRFVLKRISLDTDWVMRATEDERGRAVLAWQSGLIDRMPPEIAPEVVAGAVDGSGWALLLHDACPALVPPADVPISREEQEILLSAMAALHATFWNERPIADLTLGWTTLRQRYLELSPQTGAREAGGPDQIPRVIAEGWKLFWTLVEPPVRDLVRELLTDSTRLVTALQRYPQTVIHGDWKLGNLGIWRETPPRVVLLDWAVYGLAPPAVDLAWYLAVNSSRLPVSKEATIASYRQALIGRLGAGFDESWWTPQLELSLLGGLLQLGWPKSYGVVHNDTEEARDRERAELAWWSAHALAAERYL